MIRHKQTPLVLISTIGTIALLALMYYIVQAATTNTFKRSKAASVSCDYTIAIAPPLANGQPSSTPVPVETEAPANIPTPTPVVEVVVPTNVEIPKVSCTQQADVSIIIDRSGSMVNKESDGRSKLEWAKDAAMLFVTAIKQSNTSQVRVSVVSFGTQGNDGSGSLPSAYNSTLHIGASSDYNAVIDAIGHIAYINKSGTCGQCGLRIGNGQISQSTSTKVSIFLSDGQMNHVWNGGTSNATQATLAEAQAGRDKGIAYYVLGFGSGRTIDEPTLKSIAGSSSNYFYKPNSADWTRGFFDLLPKICTPI